MQSCGKVKGGTRLSPVRRMPPPPSHLEGSTAAQGGCGSWDLNMDPALWLAGGTGRSPQTATPKSHMYPHQHARTRAHTHTHTATRRPQMSLPVRRVMPATGTRGQAFSAATLQVGELRPVCRVGQLLGGGGGKSGLAPAQGHAPADHSLGSKASSPLARRRTNQGEAISRLVFRTTLVVHARLPTSTGPHVVMSEAPSVLGDPDFQSSNRTGEPSYGPDGARGPRFPVWAPGCRKGRDGGCPQSPLHLVLRWHRAPVTCLIPSCCVK